MLLTCPAVVAAMHVRTSLCSGWYAHALRECAVELLFSLKKRDEVAAQAISRSRLLLAVSGVDGGIIGVMRVAAVCRSCFAYR